MVSLSGSDMRVMLASENELGSVPSSSIFEWTGINYSLNVLWNSPAKSSDPGLLLVCAAQGKVLLSV